MTGKGTKDDIFAARQMIAKHIQRQKELHMVSIDLQKAYGRVPRLEVLRCMREKGVAGKYISIVKDTYVEAIKMVTSSLGQTSTIAVRVGPHQ